MKKIVSTIILSLAGVFCFAQYTDHRGHNVDSLETVVAKWDAVSLSTASIKDLDRLARDWRDLMLGYLQVNHTKSEYYARKALSLGRKMDWKETIWDSAKVLGQHFWAREQYDSAAFYYSIAMDAIERMEVTQDENKGMGYSQAEKDNGLSAMYGTLGNLYSAMDSVAVAMDYYEKALELFKKHNWVTSLAVCYANMGETVLGTEDFDSAERFFTKELECAEEAGDSLWIADAWKRFGQLYLQRGQTLKALSALEKADGYFALHEDEETMSRLELLDFTGQVLRLQKKELTWLLAVAIALALILLTLITLLFVHYRTRREKKNAEMVLEEAIEELRPEREKKHCDAPCLTERETQILRLIVEGKTNPQIAQTIFLSPETVKWYRKKLLVKFNAANSVDLVRIVLEKGILQKP